MKPREKGSGLAGVCRGPVRRVHRASVVLGAQVQKGTMPIAPVEKISIVTEDDNNHESRE